MNTEVLTKQVKDLKELKVMAEELQAEISAIENRIKQEMTTRNATELQVGIFKIRFTDVISNRFDTKAFKAIYKDLYNQFTKQVQSKRFSIA